MADRSLFHGRDVAVTGAAGFIGGAIARRLAAHGARVRGLDVDAEGLEALASAGVSPALADVTDLGSVVSELRGAELVVHTAALVHEWGAMEDFIRVNVGGTANVLTAARESGAERVAHLSSVVVYGYDRRGEQSEDSFRRTCGIPYIDTKSASDALACRRGAVVIRPGDVYGPGSVPWTLRPAALARSGQLAVPHGGGIMLPLYIDDLVRAVLLALARGEPGRAYTAWDGNAVSFEEYFGHFARMVGGRPPRRLPRPVLDVLGATLEAVAAARGTAPPFTSRSSTFVARRGTVSTTRIREELGWQPGVSLAEGMRRSEGWLREQGLL